MEFNWKGLSKTIAKAGLPMLGMALGGPPGAALASLLSKTLGLGDGDELSGDSILEALANPETLANLKRMEMDHGLELEKIGLEQDRLVMRDKQDARAAQVAREEATGERDIHLYIMAYIIVGGFFTIIIGTIAAIFSGHLDANTPIIAVSLLSSLVGALISRFSTVTDYFYGSSKSSDRKTSLLTQFKGMISK